MWQREKEEREREEAANMWENVKSLQNLGCSIRPWSPAESQRTEEKKLNQQYLATYHSDWLEIVSADQ